MKKHGIKKRVLATLMTACMIVGAVPGGHWRMSRQVRQRQIRPKL